MEAAEELREASAGTATTATATEETGFEHERVAMHLESAATALEAATIALDACAATAKRLRELAAEARAAKSTTTVAHEMETFERVLTLLEERLFKAIQLAAPEELILGIREHADRELAPYRGRMSVDQLRQVKQQFEQKQLLVNYNLPRLSLFYMSQQ
jgi:hypothetical protein